jgi:hypothetical protein
LVAFIQAQTGHFQEYGWRLAEHSVSHYPAAHSISASLISNVNLWGFARRYLGFDELVNHDAVLLCVL